jgi:mannan endo-1,4-beta-mannosidase
VIGGRPPGGQHVGGPYMDMTPKQGATTVQPGASITLSASRTFTATDPEGQWYFFPTYADSSNTYHDGADTYVTFTKSTGTGGAGGTGGSGGAAGSGGTGGGRARPSYNTGKGFFVADGRLYDSNGIEFRIRGLNKLHWDEQSPGIPKTRANTERWNIDFRQPTATNLGLMRSTIAQHIVPMPASWDGTCKSDVATLNTIVDTWIAQAAAWKTIDAQMILNIANEWGPGNSTVWRDAYIDAVRRLRNAGYLSTIAVDSGGCGQDAEDIPKYGRAVFDSDPQKNVIFDLHVYGNYGSGQYQTNLPTTLDRLAATGLVVFIGEFGPGRNIGPSPTLITPLEVMRGAEQRSLGWLAWAWDDPARGADDNWFALSYTGDYNSSADLTIFGKVVVEDANYGLLKLAKPVTAF